MITESVLFGLIALGATGAASASPCAGVVVTRVLQHGAAEAAGVRTGDLLQRWRRVQPDGQRAAGEGCLQTPFDLEDVEKHEAPLGPIEVGVTRGGEELFAVFAREEWDVRAQPRMADELRARYDSGLARAADGKRARIWQAVAERARKEGQSAAVRWLFAEAGRAWADAGEVVRARKGFAASLSQAATPSERAQVHLARSRALRSHVYDEARASFEENVRLREAHAPDSLAVAAALLELGRFLVAHDFSKGEAALRRSLEICGALAPDTAAHAGSLIWAGYARWAKGELDASRALYERAATIARTAQPDGVLVATVALGLGNLAWARGDLANAADEYRRALEIREPIEPGGREVAKARLNLGLVAMNRGDLATAEEMLDAATSGYSDRNDPSTLDSPLFQRAELAMMRGDLITAKTRFEGALRSVQNSPMALTRVMALTTLGAVSLLSGDSVGARAFLEKGLPVVQTIAPGGFVHGDLLAVLGETARRQGDLAAAGTHLESGLAIAEALAPAGLLSAAFLQSLGAVAEDRRDWTKAKQFYERALTIRQALAPDTWWEAESLRGLAGLAHRGGRGEERVALLRRSVDALDAHTNRIGGTHEARSAFRFRHGELHRELIEALVGLGRKDEALDALQRSQARVLLEQMAERNVALPSEVPHELEQERQAIRAAQVKAEKALAELSPLRDRVKVEEQLQALHEIRGRRERLHQRLRQASPRTADLRLPKALDAAGVAAALDPGTLMLAYSVGHETTQLFVVSGGDPTSLEVHTLSAGDGLLRRRVAEFRKRAVGHFGADSRRVQREAEALFRLLLAPAAARIAAAERVVVCPDGPLHLLPFAALVDRGRFLIEWKPLHVVPSATLFAELRREGDRPASADGVQLAAFGDPRPDPKHARGLGPLPSARREVAELLRLFPGSARGYLGAQATATTARTIGAGARLLHFASHARLDDRFPLESALLLSPGDGGDDGVLRAWEILEGGRLRADLVSLSACETAVGPEMGGEGLMSLTRAFMAAGARSILASLWSVSDNTTAELTKSFYSQVARGETKDRALRFAQLRLIRAGGRRARPFYWAAFQLYGDWQ